MVENDQITSLICQICNGRVEVAVTFREICKAATAQMQRTLSTCQPMAIGRPSTSTGSSMTTSMPIFIPSAPTATSTPRPSCIFRVTSTGICTTEPLRCPMNAMPIEDVEAASGPINAVAIEDVEPPENNPTPSPPAGPIDWPLF